LKIVSLKTENFKKLIAVNIEPKDSLVPIKGKNAAGKSSVLESIEIAIGGMAHAPEQPIRKGQKKAEIVVDLGELIVRRSITPSGGTLVVTTKDGVPQKTPQAILDKLYGTLSFDPLAFSRQTAQEQGKVLRDLLKLDFSTLDAERAKAYTDRTLFGRLVAQIEARMKVFPPIPESVPDEEVSATDIINEKRDADATNKDNKNQREEAAAAQVVADNYLAETERIQGKITQLQTELSLLQDDYLKACEVAMALSEAADKLVDIPVTDFYDRIAGIEKTNAAVRAKKEVKKTEAELAEARRRHSELDKAIAKIDDEKQSKIASAPFPIPGMSFNDAGVVMYQGVPFSQASSAEQLRVSLAMGIALNPKLRVLLIRDGSLLDDDNLKLIAEMATEKDMQVWIETINSDSPSAVLIEDGAVKEDSVNA